MRRAFVVVAWAVAGLIALSSLPRTAQAAFVTPSPATVLTANTTASLTDPTGPTDSKAGNDAGDLAKPSVEAKADALLNTAGEPFASGNGLANGELTISGNDIRLAALTTASVAAPAPPFDAIVEAETDITMPFTVASGASAVLEYDVTIDAMVVNNAKVVIVLTKDGDATPLFSQTFNEDALDTLPAIGAGSYSLFVSSGAEATNKGIADEQESAGVSVLLSGQSSGDALIPLPAAVVPGGAMLLALAGGMSLRRRLCRST